jgi:geranylgeranyl diphosphate synthase type II
MDNDEYRRGKKTTHAVYGEAMGILAGDALLNYAFETALLAFDAEPSNTNISKALKVLAGKAGIYGMVGGQVIDIESEDSGEMTREKLNEIYRLKTGALIEASMLIGAILAGATEEEQERIERTASLIGLAFQIQDDILDVTSTMEVLGKPIGSDEKNNKATYVTYEGVDKARADVARLSDEAVETLLQLSGTGHGSSAGNISNGTEEYDSAFLIGLITYLAGRDR